MTGNELLRLNIIEDIKLAFRGSDYPGDQNLGREEIQSFRGYSWENVPLDVLVSHRDDLMFFSVPAFCYFVPAMLLALLEHDAEVDTLHENLILMLSPPSPDRPIWDQEFFIMADGFSDQQRAVLCRFFEGYTQLFPISSLTDHVLYAAALKDGEGFWCQESDTLA